MNPVTPAALAAGQTPLTYSNDVAAAKDTNQSNGPGKLFRTFLEQTNQDQVNSDYQIQQFIEGKQDNVQRVVLAVAKAEMSFQLFMEMRNKLIESYNELMRMQF